MTIRVNKRNSENQSMTNFDFNKKVRVKSMTNLDLGMDSKTLSLTIRDFISVGLIQPMLVGLN